jgi:DNA repair exonuclease SbcCD ATPase subunit
MINNAIKYINLKQRLDKEENQLNSVSVQLKTNIEKEVSKLKEANKEIGDKVSRGILELEEEYGKIQEAISIKNRIQSIQTKINERKKFLEADDMEVMEKKISENEASISDLLVKKKQYEVAKTSIKCPCCKVTLRYISTEHKLEKFEVGDYEDTGSNSIEKELSLLIKSNNETKQRLATFKKIIDNIETLSKEVTSCEKDIPEGFDKELSTLKEISSSKKAELDSLRDKKNQMIYNNNRLKQLEKHTVEIDNNEHPSISNYLDTIKMLKSSMKAFESNPLKDNELEKLEKELDEYKISIAQEKSKITKKDRLLAKKKEIMREIEDINAIVKELRILTEEELRNFNQKLKILKIDEEDIETYLSITDIALISKEIEKQLNYLKYLEEKKNIEEKISTEKSRHAGLSDELNKIVKLYKCIELSESRLIYKFIDTLNERVNYHLETMFEEPMTVCVSCFKDTKKGEKPQIDFSVFYKGVETDISNLSGGEYDRLNLCFLLSFNELSESNMIILDEALSSLNQELVADIIEHIQECNKDNRKLVLMTLHQSIKGMFDQVIAL